MDDNESGHRNSQEELITDREMNEILDSGNCIWIRMALRAFWRKVQRFRLPDSVSPMDNTSDSESVAEDANVGGDEEDNEDRIRARSSKKSSTAEAPMPTTSARSGSSSSSGMVSLKSLQPPPSERKVKQHIAQTLDIIQKYMLSAKRQLADTLASAQRLKVDRREVRSQVIAQLKPILTMIQRLNIYRDVCEKRLNTVNTYGVIREFQSMENTMAAWYNASVKGTNTVLMEQSQSVDIENSLQLQMQTLDELNMSKLRSLNDQIDMSMDTLSNTTHASGVSSDDREMEEFTMLLQACQSELASSTSSGIATATAAAVPAAAAGVAPPYLSRATRGGMSHPSAYYRDTRIMSGSGSGGGDNISDAITSAGVAPAPYPSAIPVMPVMFSMPTRDELKQITQSVMGGGAAAAAATITPHNSNVTTSAITAAATAASMAAREGHVNSGKRSSSSKRTPEHA